MSDRTFLQDQIEELKHLVGQEGGEEARLLDLPKYPGRMLALLLKRKVVSLEAMYTATYFDKLPDDRPDIRTLSVFMSRPLRPRLKELGVTIHNQRDVGWYIEEADKKRVREAIEEIKLTGASSAVSEEAEETFKIDSDIPIPPLKGNSKYPFADLKVGQSFFVPRRLPPVMHRNAYQWRKTNGKEDVKFVVRKCPGGCRVWRIS